MNSKILLITFSAIMIICVCCNKEINLDSNTIKTNSKNQKLHDISMDISVFAYSQPFLTYRDELVNLLTSYTNSDSSLQINCNLFADFATVENTFETQISTFFAEYLSLNEIFKDDFFEEAEDISYGTQHIKGLRKFLKDMAKLIEEKEARLNTNDRMSDEEFTDRYNLIADRLNNRNNRTIINHI